MSSPETYLIHCIQKILCDEKCSRCIYVVQSSVLLYRTRRFCSRTVIDGNNQTLKLYANKTSVATIGCSVTTDILTVNDAYLSHTQIKII